MVLTVNPADAQAIQEDEAQLLTAIVQAARGAIALLKTSTSPHPQASETLRIQMGRRIVYGQVGDREFRSELNSDTIRTIFTALQKPVTEGVDSSQYQGKVPAIEIREGETILFREERDGTITVNDIQLQLEHNLYREATNIRDTEDSVFPQLGIPEISSTEPLLAISSWASEVAQTADRLLNPLGDDQLAYDSVAIGDYRIKRGGASIITVSRGEQLILVSRGGEIVTNSLSQQDWQTFNQFNNRIVLSPSKAENAQIFEEMQEEELLSRQYSSQYELWEDLQRMTPSELLTVSTQRYKLYPEGRDLAELEDQLLEQYSIIQDILNAYKLENQLDISDSLESEPLPFQAGESPDLLQIEDQVTLTADVAEATAPQDVLPAIAIAERETAKLPDGITKQLLKVTHHDWQQQIQQSLQTSFSTSKHWLAARPEHWRNQKTARAVLEIFNRGYDRTGERSYQIGEYSISFRGRNLYILRDAKGELMRFKASKLLNWQRVQVLTVSDRLGEFQCKDLQSVQRNRSIAPQGSLDIESNYAAKTNRVERTVVQFLTTKARANVWDKEGGAFRLEIGEGGFLQITDKQEGRGVIFQRQNGEISSKLNAKDFAHFERLALRMEQTQHQEPSVSTNGKVHNPQKSLGLELA